MIQDLSVSHAVASFQVLRIEIGDEDGYVRIRCDLSNGDIFEFAEYIIQYKEVINAETYSYHWQSADGKLIKRWDNVPHYKNVDTFPDHIHLPDKVINSSALSLKKILTEIEKTLEFGSESDTSSGK
jgi:hypothetical protein